MSIFSFEYTYEPEICFFPTDKIGVPSDERSWHYGCVRYSNTDSPLGNEETVLFPKVKTDESGQAKRVNKNG